MRVAQEAVTRVVQDSTMSNVSPSRMVSPAQSGQEDHDEEDEIHHHDDLHHMHPHPHHHLMAMGLDHDLGGDFEPESLDDQDTEDDNNNFHHQNNNDNEAQEMMAAGPSGSHHSVPQALTSGQSHDDNEGEVSESIQAHVPLGFAPTQGGGPMEASNSSDLWASSSGCLGHPPGRGASLESRLEELAQSPSGSANVGSSAPVPLCMSSSSHGAGSLSVMVGLPGFSPQPSSSNAPFNASSSAQVTPQVAGSQTPTTSASPMASSSSSGPASQPGGLPTLMGGNPTISSSGLISRQNSQVVPESPQSSGYSSLSLGNSPLSGAAQLLQGTNEASYPPSPRLPNHGVNGQSSGTKRERIPSPVPGTSAQSSAKRFFQNPLDPIPGPSRLLIPVSTSSEAQSLSPSRDESPLTPVDNFIISSSTGLMDSQPVTPEPEDDMNVDNDLSVPSPNPLVDEGQFRLVPNDPADDSFNCNDVSNKGISFGRSDGNAHSNSLRHSNGDESRNYASIYDNPVPGPSRLVPCTRDSVFPSTSKSSNADQNSFFSCPADLELANYNEAVDEGDGNLSSTFQDIDSAEPPVDLEDIQLQQLVPENSTPLRPDHGGAVRGGSGVGGDGGEEEDSGDINDAQDQSGSNKYLLLSDYNLTSPNKQHEDQHHHHNHHLQHHHHHHHHHHNNHHSFDGNEALDIGASYSGLRSLELSVVDPGSSSNGTLSNSPHSSILESMTGPLSKRLRTLHTMQQRQTSSSPSQAATTSTPASESHDMGTNGHVVNRNPAPEPFLSLANNQGRNENGEPILRNVHHEASPTKEHNANNNVPNSNGKSEKPSSDAADSQNSPNFGGTQHNFNVTLETPPSLGSALKVKRLFHDSKEPTLFEGMDFLTAPEDDDALGFSRIKRLRPDQSVWCPDCKLHYEDGCFLHIAPNDEADDISLQIMDTPILSRAKASLPLSHLSMRTIKDDQQDGKVGIFAKKKIPKSCKFGPLEGKRLKAKAENGDFLYSIQHGDGQITIVDTSNEDQSNWMGLVRHADHEEEQNLALLEENEELYFITTKKIGPRQELKVWYSAEYANARNLPLLKSSQGKPNPTDQSSPRNGENKKRNKCSSCPLIFGNEASMKIHSFCHQSSEELINLTVDEALAQTGRNLKLSTNPELLFQCPECDSQHPTWLDLVSHVDIHAQSIDQNPPNGRLKTIKAFKCPECYRSFESEEKLKKHSAVHGSDESKPLSCPTCSNRFLTNSALACHVKIHTRSETAYDCPMCGKEFMQIGALKEHVHAHRLNGKYDCPFCPKEFLEYPQIRKHIRAFHGNKKHACSHCPKTFGNSDKLKLHTLIHSDLKEFLCNACGKQFRRKDKLKEHWIRMHGNVNTASISARGGIAAPSSKVSDGMVETNENAPPKGTRRRKTSPKVSSLDFHRYIYKCHECVLGFKRRGMLVNHLAKRHPNITPDSVPELNLPILKTTKDYFCQYCSNVYKSSSKRKTHILKKHPGQKPPISARDKSVQHSGAINPTFSATVGSVTFLPYSCPHCHKQYASHAKLLQHQRVKHAGLESKPKEGVLETSEQEEALVKAASMLHSEQQQQQRQLEQSPPALIPHASSSGIHEIKLQTLNGEIVQLTPVAQDEALRLASNGATVIHVPEQEQSQASPATEVILFEAPSPHLHMKNERNQQDSPRNLP
eukprot:TCALIF_10850-PA protein Name:"Similar to prdm10 PR domain zinc finger protein 10 (Xenopus tropicalis)" AED:0.11 eAED:0.11 QI:0/0.66/0.6/1/0.88/0.9/10/128/1672